MASALAGAVRTAASVERHEARTEAGTYAVYEATVPAGELTLVLTAAPARETDRLWLSVGGSPRSVPESCALGVLTDGQLTRLEGERVLRDGRAAYRVPVDLALLRRMAAATRVAGRVCDREWRVGPESEGALDELVARIDEERTWFSSTGDPPRSGRCALRRATGFAVAAWAGAPRHEGRWSSAPPSAASKETSRGRRGWDARVEVKLGHVVLKHAFADDGDAWLQHFEGGAFRDVFSPTKTEKPPLNNDAPGPRKLVVSRGKQQVAVFSWTPACHDAGCHDLRLRWANDGSAVDIFAGLDHASFDPAPGHQPKQQPARVFVVDLTTGKVSQDQLSPPWPADAR